MVRAQHRRAFKYLTVLLLISRSCSGLAARHGTVLVYGAILPRSNLREVPHLGASGSPPSKPGRGACSGVLLWTTTDLLLPNHLLARLAMEYLYYRTPYL